MHRPLKIILSRAHSIENQNQTSTTFLLVFTFLIDDSPFKELRIAEHFSCICLIHGSTQWVTQPLKYHQNLLNRPLSTLSEL